MIGIIDSGSQKTPDILDCVEKLGFQGEVVPLANLENGIGNWEKVIISGAPILLSQIEDPTEYIEKARTILNLEIPVLGICFGHQIIGMHYGAQCKMGEEDRADQLIHQIVEDSIFSGLEQSFVMMQDHCEYINVPDSFIHLGRSAVTEVEVMKHQSKPIYGCQFHPEVSGKTGLQFISNFLKI